MIHDGDDNGEYKYATIQEKYLTKSMTKCPIK